MKTDPKLLGLSWQRVKFDLNKKVFVRPFELSIVESSEEEWLQHILELFTQGSYRPKSALPIDVPKENGALRLGTYINIVDTLMYTLLLGKNISVISNALKWSARTIVYSHVIGEDTSQTQWIENPFQAWTNYTNKSLEVLAEGYNYVLFTDITAYYENINIKHLISSLANLKFDKEDLKCLGNILYKWSFNQSDGLPQGYSASDVLSNVYLNDIDIRLNEEGYRFLRYGDDYRIFCNNSKETRCAQMLLTQILRSHGLNLQNKKTETLNPTEAKTKIDGITSTIETVKSNIISDVVYNPGYSENYFGLIEESGPEDTPQDDTSDYVAETFDAYFVDVNKEFNKTLFRFCLTTLAKKGDKHALKKSFELLVTHPEETPAILKYFNALELSSEEVQLLRDFLRSGNSIYEYQKYLIFRWVLTKNIEINRMFLSQAKQIAFDENKSFYLKSICKEIIGKTGSAVDLERLMSQFHENMSIPEQSLIICCVRKVEKTKRNSFYGHISSTSFLIKKAISIAKNGTMK